MFEREVELEDLEETCGKLPGVGTLETQPKLKLAVNFIWSIDIHQCRKEQKLAQNLLIAGICKIVDDNLMNR